MHPDGAAQNQSTLYATLDYHLQARQAVLNPTDRFVGMSRLCCMKHVTGRLNRNDIPT
jgi:hypothetical protein